MIRVSIDEQKLEGQTRKLAGWMIRAPEGYAGALRAGMRRVTPLAVSYIKGFAPVRTGLLFGNIRGDVRDTAFGAVGRVVADVREARYTEFGTAQHGGPKRYFLRGTAATKPEAEAIFDYEVRKMNESFGN